MLRRVPIVAVATMAVLVMTGTAASAAVRPFGAPQTVAGGCAPGLGDAVTAADGAVRGFVDCSTAAGPRIRFFSRTAAGTVNPSEQTGFAGTVMGVADDSTGTYVLFHTDSAVVIGKRTTAGVYSSRVVDAWSGVVPPTGDVIARDGQWFGVWSEQVGPGGEFAQTDLFQAGTVYPVRRVTFNTAVDDFEPSLAYSGSIPVLVWTRLTNPALPGPSDLWVSKLVGGVWQSRVFAGAGVNNYTPDIAVAGGVTFVTWGRDGRVVVASNRTGTFVSKTFNTGGFQPKVAASTTAGAVDHVFVTWTVPVEQDTSARAFFAETASDGGVSAVWNGAFVTDPPSAAFAVGGFGGKATVAYRTESSVFVRTQS